MNGRVNVGNGFTVGGSGVRKTVNVGGVGVNVGQSGTKAWVPGVGSVWLGSNKKKQNSVDAPGLGLGWVLFLTIITGGWFLAAVLGLFVLSVVVEFVCKYWKWIGRLLLAYVMFGLGYQLMEAILYR